MYPYISNNPYFHYVYHMYMSNSNKQICDSIYEEIRVPLFDNMSHIVDFNISKNLLTDLTSCRVKNIYIICHSVTGDKSEFANIASGLLKNSKNAVVSYSRKHREDNKTISLSNKYQRIFNITGCRFLLDSVVNYINTTFNPKNSKKIILLGFSAGTSLIACYLGCRLMKYKDTISYSVLVSAGYHYKESMTKMPALSQFLCVLNLYTYFYKFHVKYNHTDILSIYSNGFTLLSYIFNLYKYAGFKNKEEYFKFHDPVNYLNNIKSKVFFLNALDDFCFPGSTIIPIISKYKDTKSNFTFNLKELGSHICFYKNYTNKETIIVDYVESLETHEMEKTNFQQT